jgi:hypothetical protein
MLEMDLFARVNDAGNGTLVKISTASYLTYTVEDAYEKNQALRTRICILLHHPAICRRYTVQKTKLLKRS